MQQGTAQKVAFLIGLGVVVGIIGTVLTTNFTSMSGMMTAASISADKAGSIVQDAMEAQGQDVTIESVEASSPSMYKVIVNTGQDSLTSMYVSTDGTYLFQNPTNATAFIQQAQARTSFMDCMRSKDVQIYGRAQDRATQLQIRALGGATGLQGIYQELNNQTLQTLADQGVQQIPVTIYDGQVQQGAQSITQLSNLTGCQFPEPGQ